MKPQMKDIVTFDVSDEMIVEAKKIRAKRDEIYGNIYQDRDTDERWVGDLGEIVINHALMLCREYDTIWHNELQAAGNEDFTFCHLPLEVKTVKRKVPLRPHYKAQITARHIDSPADWLVFLSYEYPVKKMHVKGVMHKDAFKEKAEYYGAGDQVHSAYTIREGHEIYAVGIRDMMPFRKFLRDAMDGKLIRPPLLNTAM